MFFYLRAISGGLIEGKVVPDRLRGGKKAFLNSFDLFYFAFYDLWSVCLILPTLIGS